MATQQLLTARQVAERYGNVTRKTIREWVKLGRIPRPVEPFKMWRASEIDAHIASLEHAEMQEAAS